MGDSAQYVQIEGTAAALIYQNPENGYAVLRLDTEDGLVAAGDRKRVVSPGEALTLTGNWSTHQAYGRQFKAEYASRRLPAGADAIFKYLSSGAVKHIGPSKAREIVEIFGDKALEVIENEPEKLAGIRGITSKRANEISAAFRLKVGLRRLIEFLSQHGIKPHAAMAVYRTYGEDGLDAVRDNPYIMVGPICEVEFFEADAMALSLGFEADSPKRAEAAVLFELYHNLGNGHVFLPYEKLVSAAAALIDVPREPAEDALGELAECGYLVRCDVAGEDACYLPELFEAETYASARILEMAGDPPVLTGGLDGVIASVERELGITYSGGQRRAVELAGEKRLLAITGGPGTGKTTSVRGILALFDRLGLKTALCAPTGRAAKRMGELTGRDAATVHRLLGVTMGEKGLPVFQHCESDPLDADAVVLDETSMVDISLLADLLRALRPGCRLVLVGDCDQLPSVGPGNVFSDILKSGAVESVRLGEIFRQARESRIIRNAHMINGGTVPDLKDNGGDFFFLQRLSPEKTAETVVELFSERLPKNMGIDPEQIQVLSPTRRQASGTHSLNIRLQEAINPPKKEKREKIFGDFSYREGDRVMQIRNNYDIIWRRSQIVHDSCRNPSDEGSDKTSANGPGGSGAGIFNGDIGTIVEIDDMRETVTVKFDDKLATYQYEQLSELEPAYAMTVHKSQGSEYRAVILAVSQGAPQLMVRGVLYTAVTRARELLIIVGDPAAVERMTLDDRRQRRYSGLRARLSGF